MVVRSFQTRVHRAANNKESSGRGEKMNQSYSHVSSAFAPPCYVILKRAFSVAMAKFPRRAESRPVGSAK